ncbi:MAG: flagellar assembly protein FliW [Lachnospiraceae bacterium]|nr:flagellar assembly protein FliW [Lachnospiraceae bacterium]
MVIATRLFGEINVDDEKMIQFPGGIIGFSDMQNFALIHDDKQVEGGIRWLQSADEPSFAMPVIDPLLVKPDYNPVVDDEMLKRIGEFGQDDILVLTTITVPKDIKLMSVNLKAPFIINAKTKKACQIIVEDFDVKYPVYEILKAAKEG